MAGRFVLQIVQGPDQGKQFPLSATSTTIGRHAEATIVLADQQASRQHARIDLHDEHPWLRDLGSANGTFVNGTPVRQPFALSPGDTILIGNTTLRLLANQEHAEPAASGQTSLPPAPVLEAHTRLAHSSGTGPTRPHHPGALQVVAPGMVLNDRYELGEQIGQGGFARVYLATDLVLRRRIAIKVLNSDLAETEGESFLARFAQEAQAVAALDHPNILAIHDYGEAFGTVYLVMPYVEGGTLGQRLRAGGRLELDAARDYLRQAATALDYAHRRHLVHRDIKPQNMLLRAEDGRLLLSDFGIAKVVNSTSAQSNTSVMGTIAYMAPEQLQGRVTPATDIYALGCVLFQMLTGQLPFTGPTEQVMFAHLSAPVPTLFERGGGHVPAGVQGVVERALAKQPEARFRTAGDLADAFEAALRGVSPGDAARQAPTLIADVALPTSPPRTAQFPPPPPPADPLLTQIGAPPTGAYAPPPAQPPWPAPPPPATPPPPPERTGRRAFLVTGAVLGLVLIGGGGAAALIARSRDTSPTATPAPASGQLGSAVPAASAGPPTSTPAVPGAAPAAQAQAATATAQARIAQQQAATATAQANAASTAAQGGTATAQANQAQAATATAQAQAAQAATATAQARAAQAQSATATAQVAQRARDAENVVKGYYDAINRRDFDAAWALASSKVVGTNFTSWKAGYDNTLSVALTIDSTVPDGSNHRVNVRLASQERDGTTKRFAGFYSVGPENGILKMIAASIQVA